MDRPDCRNKFSVQKTQRDRSQIIEAAQSRGGLWVPRDAGQRPYSDVFSLPDKPGLEPYQMFRIDEGGCSEKRGHQNDFELNGRSISAEVWPKNGQA